MKLSIHGAARTVTGSCHLLECGGVRILIDCGMFQGGRELQEDNADPFGFDPASIDYVLLTHAHLDHVGRLPLLAKRGFRGEVIATAATFELARLVILDSVHLQTEDTRRHRRAHNGKTQAAEDEPLYSMLDALDAMGRFGRAAEYEKPITVASGIRATFFDAGHILGSASILLQVREGGHDKSILFSGDIGNDGRPLLRDPQTPAAADYVVMESTYGNREHRSFPASVDEFLDAINATLGRGGNVLIPTFALERTQDLLFCLREGIGQGILPAHLPVFLDSPMAISATEIFRRHPECYSPEMARLLAAGVDPLDVPDLHMTRETLDSIAINRIKGGAIIMAGAGMCTGGRIRHHLMGNLGSDGRDLRGLCGRGHFGPPHHRWRTQRPNIRRGCRGPRPCAHDQWILGPCRSARTRRLAPPHRRQESDVSSPWRGLGDGRTSSASRGRPDRDADAAPDFRVVTGLLSRKFQVLGLSDTATTRSEPPRKACRAVPALRPR